jgi:hypothetical protein
VLKAEVHQLRAKVEQQLCSRRRWSSSVSDGYTTRSGALHLLIRAQLDLVPTTVDTLPASTHRLETIKKNTEEEREYREKKRTPTLPLFSDNIVEIVGATKVPLHAHFSGCDSFVGGSQAISNRRNDLYPFLHLAQ